MLTMMKAERNLPVQSCLEGLHQIHELEQNSHVHHTRWSARSAGLTSGQQNTQLQLSSPNPQINVVAGQGMVHQHPQHQSESLMQQQQQQQQHSTNDVINLQYIELEEFLLENAVAAVQQQHQQQQSQQHEQMESKGLCESSPSPPGSICQQDSPGGSSSSASDGLSLATANGEKHYQITLEQRQLIAPQQQQHFGWSQHSSPPPPPQSQSPQQQHHQSDIRPMGGQGQLANVAMPNTTARKTYPRRVSTSSSTSALSVSPPPPSTTSTPQLMQQLSPPLSLALSSGSNAATSTTSPLMAAHLLETVTREVKPKKPVKRSRKESVPDDNKDEKYWKRRAKNNEAAKRSRDLRREKENHILQRVAFLERENQLLNQELNSIKLDNEELRKRLSHYEAI